MRPHITFALTHEFDKAVFDVHAAGRYLFLKFYLGGGRAPLNFSLYSFLIIASKLLLLIATGLSRRIEYELDYWGFRRELTRYWRAWLAFAFLVALKGLG